MAAVDSAVRMNLEMEADANPTIQPASPASGTDLLLQKLALQRDVRVSCGGANQVSDGQKVKRNIHSSKKKTLARPLLACWCHSLGLCTRNGARTHTLTHTRAALLGINPAAVAGVVLLARGYL